MEFAVRNIYGVALFATVFFSFVNAAYGDSPEGLQAKIEKTIDAEVAAQKDADKWSEERAEIMDEIRETRSRLIWTRYQTEKYEKYIETQKRQIAALKKQSEETAKLRMALEPYLDETAGRLESFIAADLPFLPEERKRRMVFLRQALDDYRIDLGEKLRRTLETLQVEAGYGRSVEKTSAVIRIGGVPTSVDLLRIGRTALFYHSADGRHSGRWDRSSEKWESVSPKYERTLAKAMAMAQRKRVVELLDLPVGGVSR